MASMMLVTKSMCLRERIRFCWDVLRGKTVLIENTLPPLPAFKPVERCDHALMGKCMQCFMADLRERDREQARGLN